jgi:hypothetical protein
MIQAGPDGKGIVWLASYPKSGNTWLRVFLYHLVRIKSGAPREDDEINRLARVSLYEGRLFRLFGEYLGKPVENATMDEVARVRPRVQAEIRNRPLGVSLVKTHNCIGEIAGYPLIDLSQTIGAVYMIRDPRDVSLSLAHHLGVSTDEAIRVMAAHGFATPNSKDGPFEVWGTWTDHVMSWTARPNPALLVVRYEDLSADPVAKFSEVAAHLGIEAPMSAIVEATELSTFDKLADAERVHAFRETSERADRFFREGRAGAWRDKLTADQARRIVAEQGETMQRWGYPLD